MDDQIFKELVIKKLDKIEEKHEKAEEKHDARHNKFQTSLQEMRESQIESSLILSQVKVDIPLIKQDLFEHKEGVIQNRTRIMSMETAIHGQEDVINKAIGQYKNEVEPVINHVRSMQALPGKAKSFLISTSKVLAAVVTIIGSIGAITAYFMGMFDS